jgi:hypothetical protein
MTSSGAISLVTTCWQQAHQQLPSSFEPPAILEFDLQLRFQQIAHLDTRPCMGAEKQTISRNDRQGAATAKNNNLSFIALLGLCGKYPSRSEIGDPALRLLGHPVAPPRTMRGISERRNSTL